MASRGPVSRRREQRPRFLGGSSRPEMVGYAKGASSGLNADVFRMKTESAPVATPQLTRRQMSFSLIRPLSAPGDRMGGSQDLPSVGKRTRALLPSRRLTRVGRSALRFTTVVIVGYVTRSPNVASLTMWISSTCMRARSLRR